MFRKKYWVNNIDFNDINVEKGQRAIGLYRGGLCIGTKGFDGYVCGAVLLGYFIIESPLAITKGKPHVKEVRLLHPKRYIKLNINSLYTQHKLIAQNDKAALEQFFAENWDDTTYCF